MIKKISSTFVPRKINIKKEKMVDIVFDLVIIIFVAAVCQISYLKGKNDGKNVK